MEYNEKVEVVACLPIVFRQTTGTQYSKDIAHRCEPLHILYFKQRGFLKFCCSGSISLTADVP
ncbi:MAG: hypothetical protein CO187_01135 [Zetaproteobacteria bacterium CG_4_9_14_3_um_filter_53_7]|nr:MAG: hypothetical protein CO187_01135 [Zetaproteobacteria bacterium CG_4_9_14_3_um_filter_53_7]